ncbi:hypothetical protein [Ureibacillus sp. FSL K6-0786]|uniref:hypothetical protein n=1 Tax=Ureibacillus sp. FSL K6-0786 TaxID=2954607 RepID=UPI0030DD81AE
MWKTVDSSLAFTGYLPKFKSQQKEAMLSKYLATIITNVPIEEVQQLDIKKPHS